MARRILLADDDDAARSMAHRYLENKGHQIVSVGDGRAVLNHLEQSTFDLVILDVMMPGMSGMAVLTELRERGDDTPVIMATALANPDDIVRALDLGADDYVTKPYSFAVLLARIELRLRLKPPPAPLTPPPAPSGDTMDVGEDQELDESDAALHELDANEVTEYSELAPAEQAVDAGLLSRLKRVAGLFTKPAQAQQAIGPGSAIGDRYVVEAQIGTGGFGAVYRARHTGIGQAVAIKVLHGGGKGKAFEAFRREAQNASRVRHHNAVRVYDFGVLPDGSSYLVMELLEGPTLEDILVKEGPLQVARTAEILRPVLQALSAAHKQGIVHRDVKPGNVVLHKEDDHEVPKLLDFGIAKDIDADSDGGTIVGSPAYIAPERLRGVAYDGRSDIYAAGIVLYRMLTGAFPFNIPIDQFEKLALWHVHAHAPPPSMKNPALSHHIDELVLRMLSKDPQKRPNAPDAASLIESMVWE